MPPLEGFAPKWKPVGPIGASPGKLSTSAKFLISEPLFHLKALGRICGLCRRYFKWAALAAILIDKSWNAWPFLKIDTQGSDLDVAMGAGDHLSEFVGLQTELSFVPLYADTPHASEAMEFYRSHGFVLSALVPSDVIQFPRLQEVDGIFYRPENEKGGL